jgi:uncharacterized membrane protein
MSQELVVDRHVEDEKNTARILYLVHAACWFFTLGALSIFPTLFNYGKRGDTQGTLVHSHHGWMIRSFWWYVVWIALGWVVMIFSLGLLFFVAWGIWGVTWLWKGYRLARGFIALNNNQPVP